MHPWCQMGQGSQWLVHPHILRQPFYVALVHADIVCVATCGGHAFRDLVFDAVGEK